MSLATAPQTVDAVEPRSRRRKLKALLAGGLVLGVGAAVTLSAWNDSEWAGNGFTSGTFDLEGSVDNITFADHPNPDNTANILPFALDPYNLSPGDTTYAPLAVRLDAATTYNATVAINARAVEIVNGVESPVATLDNLTYELIATDAFGCAADTTGTTLVPAGTPVGAVAGPAAFDLARGTGGDPGAAAYLCFKVTAGPDLVQGQQQGAGWQFLATSS